MKSYSAKPAEARAARRWFLIDAEGVPLEELSDLGEPVIKALKSAGIHTLEALFEKSTDDIAAIEGVGKEEAERVRNLLDENVAYEEETVGG